MRPHNRAQRLSATESLLPLFLFSGMVVFYAAILIPVAAGFTLLILELLRRQPRSSVRTLYILWLAVIGGLGWYLAAIPPYWIACIYLLIPEVAWVPTDKQRAKPAYFGFKKYFKRRILELFIALLFFSVWAGVIFLLRQQFSNTVNYWMIGILVLLVFEVVAGIIRRRKK